eukprot:7046324-Ditylum_brightwellii.AAC.1
MLIVACSDPKQLQHCRNPKDFFIGRSTISTGIYWNQHFGMHLLNYKTNNKQRGRNQMYSAMTQREKVSMI